jgi:arginyl-tRNA synthetase
MTGPTRKKKGKGKGNGKRKTPNVLSSQSKDVDPIPCSTLEEDEMTRCNQPAEEDFERCEVHQAQYRTMCKKYKDASEVVDSIKSGRELPTKEQIQRYTDLHFTLDKASWVREYLESIRVERTGREIHQKRFFLKGEPSKFPCRIH